MTGLDINTDKILEIALVVTDEDLNVLSKTDSFYLNHPEAIYENIKEPVFSMHSPELLDLCRKSKLTEADVDLVLSQFLITWTPRLKCPLAGNSPSLDRQFIAKYLPLTYGHIHHQSIDVSTLSQLAKRWYPGVEKDRPKKKLLHRSLNDIEESIDQLKHYRIFMLK
ncbi:putative oligoribonuclease [Thelohanellus kitauei]|uniref:Putative oligoribonuclease n=1 Tax=Thelohanellus kitauei TaxID=669202 RepID=A0A0C2M8X2_THEKT|nr:putative oligoribonuclease [Thelohanellus kitauei]